MAAPRFSPKPCAYCAPTTPTSAWNFSHRISSTSRTRRWPSLEARSMPLRPRPPPAVPRLSLAQYLPPSPESLPVSEYIHPDQFAEYEAAAKALGFGWVKAGPLVRSSYPAEEIQEHTAKEQMTQREEG